jgi:hypothetical protein
LLELEIALFGDRHRLRLAPILFFWSGHYEILHNLDAVRSPVALELCGLFFGIGLYILRPTGSERHQHHTAHHAASRKRFMEEILARLWHNITARLTGPMNIRLIVQPTVATILAIRAGLRDARQNRPPFFWALFWKAAHRRELLRQGWKDVGKVFLLAAILDVVYQLIVHRGVYVLELLITAVTLAIVPYVLVRGPINRIAKMAFAVRLAMKQPPIQ